MPSRRLPPVLDVWKLATGTTDLGCNALVIGRSTAANVSQLMKVRGRGLKLTPHLPGGWPSAASGDFFFKFNPDLVLEGVSYGFRPGDILTSAVEDAICHAASTASTTSSTNDLEIGSTPVLFNGRLLREVATFPGFLSMTPPTQPFRLTGRASDKWLRAEIDFPLGVLTAEFLLKTVKVPFEAHFQIDYCLYGIGFMTGAANTDRSIPEIDSDATP